MRGDRCRLALFQTADARHHHKFRRYLFVLSFHSPSILPTLHPLPNPKKIMMRTRLLLQAERLINRNPHLYGPGPLARRPAEGSIGAMDPLKGLVVCASQGLAVAVAGGLAYNVFIGNPSLKKVEDYYKENPPR